MLEVHDIVSHFDCSSYCICHFPHLSAERGSVGKNRGGAQEHVQSPRVCKTGGCIAYRPDDMDPQLQFHQRHQIYSFPPFDYSDSVCILSPVSNPAHSPYFTELDLILTSLPNSLRVTDMQITKRLLVALSVFFASLANGAPGPKPDILKIDIHTSDSHGREQSPVQHNGVPAALVHQSGDGKSPFDSFPFLLNWKFCPVFSINVTFP